MFNVSELVYNNKYECDCVVLTRVLRPQLKQTHSVLTGLPSDNILLHQLISCTNKQGDVYTTPGYFFPSPHPNFFYHRMKIRRWWIFLALFIFNLRPPPSSAPAPPPPPCFPSRGAPARPSRARGSSASPSRRRRRRRHMAVVAPAPAWPNRPPLLPGRRRHRRRPHRPAPATTAGPACHPRPSF